MRLVGAGPTDEMNMNSSQRDWLQESKEKPADYFSRQFKQPYRSTVALHQWLKKKGVLKGRIADLACGMGAPLGYFAIREPQCDFVGLDFNSLLVREGNRRLSALPNVQLKRGNLYRLFPQYKSQFDGLLSLQTLSWLESYEGPLEQMTRIRPKWIAITSLFYDGPVNSVIRIQDYSKPTGKKAYKDAFYNIYSLPLIREFLKQRGYAHFDSTPFEIDRDIPPPKDKGMATYTRRLKSGDRIQISGPLLMSWYFLLARRAR